MQRKNLHFASLAVLLLTSTQAWAQTAVSPHSQGKISNPLINQTKPYYDPMISGEIYYRTGDELANSFYFSGAYHINSITFKYAAEVPVNYVLRFYKQPQYNVIGDLITTIVVPNLPAGTAVRTVSLTPAQEFDWVATPFSNGFGSGGFYSIQLTLPDGGYAGTAVGHPIVVGYTGVWYNVNQGQFEDVFTTGVVPGPDPGDAVVPGFYIRLDGNPIVTAPLPQLSALTPASITLKGGTSTTGTITLTSPAVSGVTVSLTVSSGSSASVPAAVTIPVGASSATYTITTSAVTKKQQVTIRATYGTTTKTQSLTITR